MNRACNTTACLELLRGTIGKHCLGLSPEERKKEMLKEERRLQMLTLLCLRHLAASASERSASG